VPAYHHGDLRRALLDAAVTVIEQDGVSSLSLRDLARRVGVSHAAPAHHFGDKSGLLTALAVEGHRMQAAMLREAWERRTDFLDVGVAYVRFAVEHRAHFEVMYRPDLLDPDDEDLREARRAAGAFLYGPAGTIARDRHAAIAAWSLMHGIATLWLTGNIPAGAGKDPEKLARAAGRYLFR